MAEWRCHCLTANLIKTVTAETVPTDCPVDNCGNFTAQKDM